MCLAFRPRNRCRLFALHVMALGVAANLGLGRAFDELAMFAAAAGLGDGGRGAGEQADGGKREHELFHDHPLRLGRVECTTFPPNKRCAEDYKCGAGGVRVQLTGTGAAAFLAFSFCAT